MKQRSQIRTILVPVMAAALLLCAVLTMFAGRAAASAETLPLVYKLDFADPADRGKNAATSGIGSAEIVDGGGVTYAADGVRGTAAMHLASNGRQVNYAAIPGAVLDSGAVTIAGWFRIDGSVPAFSRLLEINNGKTGTEQFSWLSVMPFAPSMYNGLHIHCGVDGQVRTGADGAENLVFEGGDPATVGYNTPQAGYILPVYDAWVHYAYRLSPEGFSLFQNGKLVKTVAGDFTASQFYSDTAKVYLGATFYAADADFTGAFSDIRVYAAALDEQQLISEYDLKYTDFLTTSFDFEAGAAESVRGYDGTLCGSATTADDAEKGGKVLLLDGRNAGSVNETMSSMDLPLKTLHGHNELTISADVFVDSDCANYARIFDFSVRGGQFLSLGAKWGNATTLMLKYTRLNDRLDWTVTAETLFNRWVNITLTLDGTRAVLYLDGLKVAENANFAYKNSIFWEGANYTMAVGRTQYYGDPPFKGSMDDIKIYQKAMTEKEVMMDRGVTDIEDDALAVAQEKAALLVQWDGTASKLELPAYGGEGVRIAWSSDRPDVITDEGNVLPPAADTDVTLTATLSRGGATDTKTFVFTVRAREIVDPSVVSGTRLADVTMRADSYYRGLMDANLDFMMELDPDRLLYNFRSVAGLDTLGAESYGAWISPTGNGAGQFEAHYVVALVKASRTVPDYRYKGESALDRLTYMLTEMKKCQDAFAQKDPENAGYFGAIIVDNFDALEEGRTVLENGTTRWVPWYFYHKDLEALVDVYTHAEDAALRQTARTMLEAAADWTYNRMDSITPDIRARVLLVEYGGMAEVLYQTYKITLDPHHFKAAQYFEEKNFLDNVYRNVDLLNGLHANTTIPKLLGCAAAYEVTGDPYYKTVAVNGFEMIMTRTYANGSTSKGEFWQAAGETAVGNDTAETCCSYNMLKYADYLYRWTGDKKYADYYENVYTNHILASMAPDSGLKTYLTNSAFGSYKIYHTADNSFWCCACTGMESFAQLTYGLYYTARDTLRVNMFYPSAVRLGEGLSVEQSGDFYTDQKAVFTVSGSGTFTLALRLPDWAEKGAVVKINGQAQTVEAGNGYFELDRAWSDGDTVEYEVPFSFRLDLLKGSDNTYALFYGPLLFVADLGTDEVYDVQADHTVFGTGYTGPITDKIVPDGELDQCASVTSDADGSLTLALRTRNQGTLTFRPFNRLFHNRYGMYFDYYDTVEEAESDYTVAGNEWGSRFDRPADLEAFTLYSATGSRPTVENGKLVTPAAGEMKLMTGRQLAAPYVVEARFAPYVESGAINAGLYLSASRPAAGQDKIVGYNIQIEREAGAPTYRLSVFKFNNAFGGVLHQATLTMPESGVIALHVFVKETECSVFVDGRKTAAMTFLFDRTLVGEQGDVGLRSQVSRVLIDDLRVISPALSVGKGMLESAVSLAEALDLSGYTPSTAAQLSTALTAAKAVAALETAVQAEVNAAEEALRAALDGLKQKGDPSGLMAAADAARLLDERNYTARSWQALAQVLGSIEAADPSGLSAEEIVALETALRQALFGLRYGQPAGALADAIVQAETLREEDYTAESWQRFREALERAKGLAAGASAAQADAAAIELLSAQSMLVAAPVPAGADGWMIATIVLIGAAVAAAGALTAAWFIKRRKKV